MSTEANSDGAAERVVGCSICDIIHDVVSSDVITETEHFRANYMGHEYPWGVLISTKTHNFGLWQLPEDQGAEVGALLVRLAKTMHQTWRDHSYITSFGEERSPHFHIMISTRYEPISLAAHDAIYAHRASTVDRHEEARRAMLSMR